MAIHSLNKANHYEKIKTSKQKIGGYAEKSETVTCMWPNFVKSTLWDSYWADHANHRITISIAYMLNTKLTSMSKRQRVSTSHLLLNLLLLVFNWGNSCWTHKTMKPVPSSHNAIHSRKLKQKGSLLITSEKGIMKRKSLN